MDTFLQAVAANQRFLGKTNPTMTAAVADGGSILDREYIQRAARGIVDAGLWGNLKFWGCAGLAKLRNSGGVDYVPKLYDLSGNGNHGVQTTEANQPVWGATGLTFDGSNDYLNAGNDASINALTEKTVSIWAYIHTIPINASGSYPHLITQRNTTANVWGVLMYHDYYGRIAISHVGATAATAIGFVPNVNTWYHLVFSISSSLVPRIYVNGTEEASYFTQQTGVTLTTNTVIPIGIGDRVGGGRVFDGSLNDIRIYNIALTAAQIAAIYNQTSYRYA